MAVEEADQAMCRVSCQGDTTRGWYILRQAVHLGQELGLFTFPNNVHLPSFGESLPERDRISAITAWGIFSSNLLVTISDSRESKLTERLCRQMSMKLRKYANLASPAYRVQQSGSHDFDWTPYPRSNQITYHSKPGQLPRVREGLAEITNIMIQAQQIFYEEALTSSFQELSEQANEPFHRLHSWLLNWPDGLQGEKAPVPQLLILR